MKSGRADRARPFSVCFLVSIAFLACRETNEGIQLRARGMALGAYAHSTAEEVRTNLREIKGIGANAVLLKVSEVQEDWLSDTLGPDPHLTISYGRLREMLQAAKAEGLEVALMPIVLLRSPRVRTDWRGMIQPRSPQQWFHSYGNMIEKYARLAEEKGVALFGVGSELVSMERYTDEWVDLIARVRKNYSGKIFYSSNWDHLGMSPAWSQLDALGVNAYFELAKKGERPSKDELVRRWKPVLPAITKWAKRVGKPLVVTEIGYPSRFEGLYDPWDHFHVDSVDLSVQVDGYEAFLEAWSDLSALAGVFFYEWGGPGGEKDAGYTPKGKPALVPLQKWMQAK